MLDRYRVNDMIEGAKNFAASAAGSAANTRNAARVERRSAARPWADRGKAGAGADAARRTARANGTLGGANTPAESKSDSEWREF